MATADRAGPDRQLGWQLGKITKKNNHIPYNVRYWKCPPSSIHFWHLFRKCAFTWINSISEIQSISCLILAFYSSNVWGFVAYTLFFQCPIDKNRKSPHIRRTESKYQEWNWINPRKFIFPKKLPKMCGWRTTFSTSYVIRYVIIFLCHFTQLQDAMQMEYCFGFAGLYLDYQRFPSLATMLWVTLMWKAL